MNWNVVRNDMPADPRREQFSHELVIDNFMARRASLDAMVESPKFRGGGELDWSIRVYPRGKDGQNGFGAYLYLSGTPKGLKTAVIERVDLELTNDRQMILTWVYFNHLAVEVGAEKGFSLEETDNIPVSESGKLIVCVKVFCHRDDNEILFNNFTKLREDRHLADFTIVSNLGRRFRTHKIVLATRIPEIFGEKFRDEDRQAVQVKKAKVNVSEQSCAALLEFLYTNEISLPASMELFQLADEWKLNRLKAICGNQLVDKINVENVATFHRISLFGGPSELRYAAEKFVDDHQSDARWMIVNGSHHSGVAIGDFELEYDSDRDSVDSD